MVAWLRARPWPYLLSGKTATICHYATWHLSPFFWSSALQGPQLSLTTQHSQFSIPSWPVSTIFPLPRIPEVSNRFSTPHCSIPNRHFQNTFNQCKIEWGLQVTRRVSTRPPIPWGKRGPQNELLCLMWAMWKTSRDSIRILTLKKTSSFPMATHVEEIFYRRPLVGRPLTKSWPRWKAACTSPAPSFKWISTHHRKIQEWKSWTPTAS